MISVGEMSNKQMLAEIAILEEIKRRDNEPLKTFTPYEKQREFYRSVKKYSENCLMAGNQVGKTISEAVEVAYHLTGDYPDDWEGLRFDKAPVIWVCGETGEVIRDTSQKYLVGRPGELDDPETDYTGLIPRRKIKHAQKAKNSNNLLDYLVVKHSTGKPAYCFFKAYAKGRQKFQGETIDLIWFDEEPPPDIYNEGMTRTNNGQHGRRGVLTFTPLLGMSDIVFNFLQDPSKQQNVVNMTISDAGHYSEEEKEAIIAGYPEHERDARAKGIPIMGSGRVFQIAEEFIKEDRIEWIPRWWRQIAGIDFGWDHPTGAVLIYHDPDVDVIHVRSAVRAKEHTPLMFAPLIRPWGNVRFAWPHDGLQHDKGSGVQLAEQYKAVGLKMLSERATFEDGTSGVEAGIMEMSDRMKTGRLKVDSSLHEWFEEFRLYHRKDGIIQKIRDDIMSATRYAVMMLRFATRISGEFESAPEPEVEPDY